MAANGRRSSHPFSDLPRIGQVRSQMQPSDTANRLPASATEMAALLQAIRDISRAELLATAAARQEFDRAMERVAADARAESSEFTPDARLLERYAAVWNEYGEPGGQPFEPAMPTALEEAETMWRQCVERCSHQIEDFQGRRRRYDEDRRRVFGRPKQEPRIPDQFRIDLWTMKAILDALPSLREAHVAAASARRERELALDLDARAAERAARTAEDIERRRADLLFGIELLGHLGDPWSRVLAETAGDVAARELPLVRLGRFESVAAGAVSFEVPCTIEFPGDRPLVIESPVSRRDAALEVVRSVVLRALMSMPPGRIGLSLFDPVAMGRSFADFLHLGDFDERLVDTKPRSSARDIEARLEEHVGHLETVIGKYLRGQYSSIREYNARAGDMAEPYRLLVVCDYPSQFTDRACEMLLSLAENGARCGIHLIVHGDPEAAAQARAPFDRLVRNADHLAWHGQNVRVALGNGLLPVDVIPDACPPISFSPEGAPSTGAARVLVAIGRQARCLGERVVDLDYTFGLFRREVGSARRDRLPVLREGAPAIQPEDPSTWWSGSSVAGATAILGRAGAQEVAPLYFSSTDIAGGALMVGLPRSGKTTALHAAILSLCIVYSPQELELYLIDAKHGVEFSVYRDLPHARMVAINNEREFAVAVLASLDEEIRRRAELMKTRSPGRANLEDYRLTTGDELPRIVVVIDEFHEIFEDDDQLGRQAFAAFSNIVRQGPFAGVHLVLASQTLSNMPAMDRNTLTLLPARIAFACNESDAQVVMGPFNQDARFLTRAGEGLLNPSRGEPVHNMRFQGTFVPPQQRDDLVAQIVAKAAGARWERRPRVFDGDSLAEREQIAPSVFVRPPDRPHRARFVLGEPLSLDDRLEIAIRRTGGQNILLVSPADDEGLPEPGLLGVIHSILLGTAPQFGASHVVDLVNDEGGVGGAERRVSLAELCAASGASLHRRRGLPALVAETAELVRERTTLEDYRSPGRLLLLFGVQRASELDPESYDDDSPASALRFILRDGPEVGVHVCLVANTLAGLTRRLGSGALDDISIRIAGHLPTDQERQQMLDAYRALDLRPNQLVLFDRESDLRAKFRPYGPVTTQWLTLAPLEAQMAGATDPTKGD